MVCRTVALQQSGSRTTTETVRKWVEAAGGSRRHLHGRYRDYRSRYSPSDRPLDRDLPRHRSHPARGLDPDQVLCGPAIGGKAETMPRLPKDDLVPHGELDVLDQVPCGIRRYHRTEGTTGCAPNRHLKARATKRAAPFRDGDSDRRHGRRRQEQPYAVHRDRDFSEIGRKIGARQDGGLALYHRIRRHTRDLRRIGCGIGRNGVIAAVAATRRRVSTGKYDDRTSEPAQKLIFSRHYIPQRLDPDFILVRNHHRNGDGGDL